jgi:hypothetical protein
MLTERDIILIVVHRYPRNTKKTTSQLEGAIFPPQDIGGDSDETHLSKIPSPGLFVHK